MKLGALARFLGAMAVLLVGNSLAPLDARAEGAPAVSGKTPANETMLTVWSDGEMLSKAEVTYSSLGFRIKSQIGSSFWLVSNPTKATLMNPENKVFLVMPVEDYIEELREGMQPMPLAKVSAGADVTLSNNRKGKKFDCFTGEKDTEGKDVKGGEFTCITAKLPVAVHQMWCRFMTVDYSPKRGLPIGAKQTHRRKRMRNRASEGRLRPMKVIIEPRQIKDVPLDAKLFEIPKGYHRSSDRASLYFSVDGNIKKDDIEDLFMQPIK